MKAKLISAITIALLCCGQLQAQTKSDKTAAELIGDVTVGKVADTKPVQMPVILWGAESARF